MVFYTIIQLQMMPYSICKFIDFYNNYFKSDLIDNFLLFDSVKTSISDSACVLKLFWIFDCLYIRLKKSFLRPGCWFHKLKLPLSAVAQGTPCFVEKHNFCLSVKPFGVFQKRVCKISCSMNMSAQQSDDHGKMKLDQLIDKARKLWDSSPEPVKIFPWNRALDNFIQLILDLILVVVKYLAVPVFAVTSLSEMSYCAHERKLALVPLPVLFGVAVAGILKETALELSPHLKVWSLVIRHFII